MDDAAKQLVVGIDANELGQRMRLRNANVLEPFIKAGQPVVLLAAHHCNWEWLLLASCVELKVSVDAVYKPLRVGVIDRFMQETRSRFGGNPIAVDNFIVEAPVTSSSGNTSERRLGFRMAEKIYQ